MKVYDVEVIPAKGETFNTDLHEAITHFQATNEDEKGKVIEALPKKGKVVVEGVNKVKRHTKASQKMPQGGILVKEAAVSSSKVMLVCPSCDKPTRIKKTALASGSMARTCKKCGEIIDKEK